MDPLISKNPVNGEEIHRYQQHPDAAIETMIALAVERQKDWKKSNFSHRKKWLLQLANMVRKNAPHLAILITSEMGKPLEQSKTELEKCAWLCEYYANHAEEFLSGRTIKTDAKKSFVRYDPLGVILGVMPWNFPFWQAFRFAVPAVMAGNAVLVKHASNVPGCAEWIERLFLEAGAIKGLYQNLLISSSRVENVIRHPAIKAVSLTGSETAGRAVASIAGSELKKCVLELGGSNAFVVFDDANLKEVIPLAVKARMLNNGQSCIAAKRFLVQSGIADAFVEELTDAISKLKMGDPIHPLTDIGPLARVDLAEQLDAQVKRALEAGADLHLGGNQKGAFYEPSILLGVRPGNPAFDEELFGPVACVAVFTDEKEAVKMVNQSNFGLGVTVCTSDKKRIEKLIPKFEDGAVFFNELVKSDPRLPFGGTKNSGYGRELSKEGIREFTNLKAVYIA